MECSTYNASIEFHRKKKILLNMIKASIAFPHAFRNIRYFISWTTAKSGLELPYPKKYYPKKMYAVPGRNEFMDM